jgi:hypothetical protein
MVIGGGDMEPIEQCDVDEFIADIKSARHKEGLLQKLEHWRQCFDGMARGFAEAAAWCFAPDAWDCARGMNRLRAADVSRAMASMCEDLAKDGRKEPYEDVSKFVAEVPGMVGTVAELRREAWDEKLRESLEDMELNAAVVARAPGPSMIQRLEQMRAEHDAAVAECKRISAMEQARADENARVDEEGRMPPWMDGSGAYYEGTDVPLPAKQASKNDLREVVRDSVERIVSVIPSEPQDKVIVIGYADHVARALNERGDGNHYRAVSPTTIEGTAVRAVAPPPANPEWEECAARMQRREGERAKLNKLIAANQTPGIDYSGSSAKPVDYAIERETTAEDCAHLIMRDNRALVDGARGKFKVGDRVEHCEARFGMRGTVLAVVDELTVKVYWDDGPASGDKRPYAVSVLIPERKLALRTPVRADGDKLLVDLELAEWNGRLRAMYRTPAGDMNVDEVAAWLRGQDQGNTYTVLGEGRIEVGVRQRGSLQFVETRRER